MQTAQFIFYMKQTLYLVFWLSLPPIAVASVVGIVFSLFQALTQIQEQTLSFAVKLLAVGVTLLLSGAWMGSEVYNFTVVLFDAFHRIR